MLVFHSLTRKTVDHAEQHCPRDEGAVEQVFRLHQYHADKDEYDHIGYGA